MYHRGHVLLHLSLSHTLSSIDTACIIGVTFYCIYTNHKKLSCSDAACIIGVMCFCIFPCHTYSLPLTQLVSSGSGFPVFILITHTIFHLHSLYHWGQVFLYLSVSHTLSSVDTACIIGVTVYCIYTNHKKLSCSDAACIIGVRFSCIFPYHTSYLPLIQLVSSGSGFPVFIRVTHAIFRLHSCIIRVRFSCIFPYHTSYLPLTQLVSLGSGFPVFIRVTHAIFR